MLMISCESAALIFIKSKIFSILRFPHEVRGFYSERLILRESVSQSRSDTRTFRLTTSHSGNRLLLTVTDSRSKMISRVSCGGSRPCMSPSAPPTSCWSSGSRECADWRHSRACYPPPPARGQQRRSSPSSGPARDCPAWCCLRPGLCQRRHSGPSSGHHWARVSCLDSPPSSSSWCLKETIWLIFFLLSCASN